MSRLAAGGWILLVALSALGWGQGLRRLARRPGGPWAVTLGLGLAALVLAGGLLNLLHLARAPALLLLVAAGLAQVASLPGRARPAVPADPAARRELVLAATLGVAASGFTFVTLVPPTVFNFHDDLQKYLFHPVWMLQSGTLAAGPVSALGVETLGGQAFLQGLLVAVLPLPHAGSLDAVLGFAALVALAAAAGWRRLGPWPAAALGPLLVAAVNPQVVNVSALYTAAALMATAVLLAADDDGRPRPLLLGAVYAALAALKPTFLLFPALHLPVLVLARRREGGLEWGLRVAGAAVAFLAPWLLLHAPMWLGPRATLPPPPPGWDDPLSLLSPAPLFYGATALHYTALGAAALAGAGLAVVGAARRPDPARRRLAAGVAAAALAGCGAPLVLVFVTGPAHAGHEVGLRYAVPFLLGGAVPALLLSLGTGPGPVWRGALGATAVAVAVAFAPSALVRARQAAEHRTVLAYRGAPGYRPYTDYALSHAARDRLRALQGLVPEGAPLLAWVNWPYHLDLARNPVEVVEPTAFGAPWAHLPRGVRYVLWQYRGYATRDPAYLDRVAAGPGRWERRTALQIRALVSELERSTARGTVLADDGELLLVDLGVAGLGPGPRTR